MANLSRRVFLKASLGAGASFVLGAYLSGCENATVAETTPAPSTGPLAVEPTLVPPAPPPTLAASATPLVAARAPIPATAPAVEPTSAPATASFTPSVFLRIDNNNLVTITVSRSEMGQGVRTALPMIVAEELDADWSTVRVEQALADDRYGRQNTFGSRSIFSMWDILRQTGATARAMLITAAANIWGVEAQELATESGVVVHRPTDRRLTYGQLVETAAQLPVPEQVALKDPAAFRIIGTPHGQHDAAAMINGSAIYGIDVRLAGMRYAVVARSPVFGGRLIDYNAVPVRAVDGVRQVVGIDNAVAVVADTTWAAMQGRAALQVAWAPGPNAQLSSAAVQQDLRQQLPEVQGRAVQGGRLEAIYEIPYYAHATMEPMNCVADVRPDRCDVWAPTQAPQSVRAEASRITGLPEDAVTVHVTLMGMGLGRRSATDFVAEAVQVSKAIGTPVQVLWTREDDMRHDFYHPTSVHYLRAAVDPAAEIQIRTAGGARRGGAIPTGAWRSVSNFPQAFIHESFVDELAAALGHDPYELRRQRLTDKAQRAVLELAASNAGWGRPLPAGTGRGIAFYVYGGGRGSGAGTYVAQVVEASVDAGGRVRVRRVVCAVDCGIAINPAMITAQIEGGIVHAITATLKGAITVVEGRAQQGNFDDYPLLRIDEMPVVEVHSVPSSRPPQGMGEMGVPTLAPALANAIFNATGKRIRRLPIRAEDLA